MMGGLRNPRLRMLACLTAAAGGFVMPILAQSKTKEEYVNRRDFEIPVIFNLAPEQVKAVQLWTSVDKGRNWTMSKRGDSTRKAFRMNTESDGEYWFSLAYTRTDGRTIPADVPSKPPGMKVIVDTVEPEVTLRAIPSNGDRAGVEWTIRDDYPDLKTLTVKLKSSSDPAWHELRVANPKIEGKTEWPVDAGDSYTVEVSLSDRAGNEGKKRVEIPATSGGGRRIPESPIARRNPTEDLLEPKAPAVGSKSDPRDWAVEYPAKSAPTTGDLLDEPPPPSAKPVVKSLPAPPTMNLEEPKSAPPILPQAREMTAGNGNRRNRWQPERATAPPSEPSFDPSKVDLPPDLPADHEAVAKADRGDPANSTAGDYRQVSHNEAQKPVAPAPPKVKLVGGRRFQMNYNVDGAGPAGVGAVDLYMTRDGGQTWEKAGGDSDLESPMDVELPGDGKYGLSVVVLNKAGMGDHPPRSGDQPQLRVDVDTDPPYAVLQQVVADPTAPRQAMLLKWTSEDNHPAERAVDLYYSHDPQRGWYKIAGGLPATGAHSWKVPRGVPHQVYFRMIARDQAGNEENIYSMKPVIVDLSSPQGRIDGILSVLPEKKLSLR